MRRTGQLHNLRTSDQVIPRRGRRADDAGGSGVSEKRSIQKVNGRSMKQKVRTVGGSTFPILLVRMAREWESKVAEKAGTKEGFVDRTEGRRLVLPARSLGGKSLPGNNTQSQVQ